MSFTRKLFLILCLFLIANCSKDDPGTDKVDPIIKDEDPDDRPDPEIEPKPVALIFPENRSECNEGVYINEEWSLVNFQWKAAEDTDTYEIRIKNSKNQTWTSVSTDKTETEIQLLRGVQYQWRVISKNSNSTKIATSETWDFYNSGHGITNYAPFTPTLTYPRNEQILRSGDNYYFEWSCSDLDNDPLIYDLFVGRHPDSLNLVKTLSQTQEYIYGYAKRNEWYYWKIQVSDDHGNISISETNSFIRK